MPSRWFRIAYAENALRRHAVDAGRDLAALRASDAVALMTGFYRDHRAQHARITDDGDGLLWQWGPDADGERFTIDITRQLIREGDDQPIVQLSLCLAYRWTPARRALGRGHRWLFTPTGLAEFERAIRSSDAYRAVTSATPAARWVRTETL